MTTTVALPSVGHGTCPTDWADRDQGGQSSPDSNNARPQSGQVLAKRATLRPQSAHGARFELDFFMLAIAATPIRAKLPGRATTEQATTEQLQSASAETQYPLSSRHQESTRRPHGNQATHAVFLTTDAGATLSTPGSRSIQRRGNHARLNATKCHQMGRFVAAPAIYGRPHSLRKTCGPLLLRPAQFRPLVGKAPNV